MSLTQRCQQRLIGVHPDLVLIVTAARELCKTNFIVLEGVRTLAKQREYFAAGKSKTMNSRHLPSLARGLPALVSHAVDLAPMVDLDGDGDLDLSWNARDFKPIADAMKAAAAKLRLTIEWGGDWKSFVDCPHFQLPRGQYP